MAAPLRLFALLVLASIRSIVSSVISHNRHVSHILQHEVEEEVHKQFSEFIKRHSRKYHRGTPEYNLRLELYKRRKAQANAHNQRPGRRWTAGLGPLSDRTDLELAQLRGWRGSAKRGGRAVPEPISSGTFLSQQAVFVAPEEQLNWTKLTSVKDVLDQGSCGSCWAVASAVMLEAHTEIRGTRRSFSVQELIDCVPNPRQCGGSGGCEGATIELAMQYFMSYGLKTKEDVPYQGEGGQCKLKGDPLQREAEALTLDLISSGKRSVKRFSRGAAVGMSGWERLPENRYKPVLRALVELGPVGVSVAASDWALYEKGVYDGCPLDAVIDHAVILLGYGHDRASGDKYWLVQNSWGDSWGERGRIRLLRRDDEEERCGVDNQPEMGTGCKSGPTEVTVCGQCGILYDVVVPHFKK